MTKILLVHGRSQGGKDQTQLRTSWIEALNKGYRAAGLTPPADADISFPYYADILDGLTDAPPELGEEAASPTVSLDAFQQEMLDELRKAMTISDEEIQEELRASADPSSFEDGEEWVPPNWEWVQNVLRVIARKHPAFANRMLARFTKDVWVYLTHPGVRDRVDGIVSALLTGEPTVIVAHSLGTIVAYSVLHRKKRNIPRLVTLGSPLGVDAVRRQLEPISFPDGVGEWINGYDEQDFVALRGLDEASFDVWPRIQNLSTLKNQTFNRHSIVGYLDDAAVARAIG